jgi:hypothetical protein
VRLLGSDGVGRSEPKQPSVASIESRWERSNNVPRIFLSPRMLMHILPDFFDFAFTVEMLVRIPAEADQFLPDFECNLSPVASRKQLFV